MKKMFKAIVRWIKRLFSKKTAKPLEQIQEQIQVKLTSAKRHYVYFDKRLQRKIRKPLCR